MEGKRFFLNLRSKPVDSAALFTESPCYVLYNRVPIVVVMAVEGYLILCSSLVLSPTTLHLPLFYFEKEIVSLLLNKKLIFYTTPAPI
jgi:hypothetical protein